MDDIDSLRLTVKKNPTDGNAHALLAQAHARAGNAPLAIRAYEEAARLLPTNTRVLTNLSSLLIESGQSLQAIAYLRRALKISPADPVLGANMIAALNQSGPPADALAFAREFMSFPEAARFSSPDRKHFNLGVAQGVNGLLAESLASLERAAGLGGGTLEVSTEIGFLHLAAGEYEKGYTRLLARDPAKVVDPAAREVLASARWDGRELGGGTLLVLAEQGAGDAVQFARYLGAARQRAGRVIVRCGEPLVRLLQQVCGAAAGGQQAGGYEVVATTADIPRADAVALMMDLPLLLGMSTDLCAGPYLAPDPARVAYFKSRLNPRLRHIGLCWSGNPRQPVNPRRAVDPRALAAAFSAIPGTALVSLQKVLPPGQACSKGCLDLTAELKDFADTAALMSALDLVVTTDTSTAHLAGALGLPAIVLLHHPSPHWPYGLTGDQTPWYPTLQLVRQTTYGDWSPALTTAREMCLMLGTESR